jgi:hypothetical protein
VQEVTQPGSAGVRGLNARSIGCSSPIISIALGRNPFGTRRWISKRCYGGGGWSQTVAPAAYLMAGISHNA